MVRRGEGGEHLSAYPCICVLRAKKITQKTRNKYLHIVYFLKKSQPREMMRD
jgi:hypothetical protein